jgi:tRNA(fMet)-specific endonuclease VapC
MRRPQPIEGCSLGANNEKACRRHRRLRHSHGVRNPQGKVAKRIAKVGENNVCTSIIVASELRYGCAKAGSPRLTKAVEEILGEIAVLPFDVPADAEYGVVRSELEAAGKAIGSNDLLTTGSAGANSSSEFLKP